MPENGMEENKESRRIKRMKSSLFQGNIVATNQTIFMTMGHFMESIKMTDFSDLKAKAEKADDVVPGPGVWLHPAGERTVYASLRDGSCGIAIVRTDYSPPNKAASAILDYIAASNPATILSLLGQLEGMMVENAELRGLLDVPHTDDWIEAVRLEAGHQVKRFGVDHDEGKEPADWFWLIGYLAGKALAAAISGNVEKAKHHTISTGAALLNWFHALNGDSTAMRPGIANPALATSKEDKENG